MKKRISLLLTLALCLTVVPGVSAGGSPFTDVPDGHWAYDTIIEANSDGI